MEDDEFSGDIVEKKQFLVSNGRLKDAVDTDSNINDAILLEALGGNSGVKMKMWWLPYRRSRMRS